MGTDATSGFSGVGGLTVTGGSVFSLLANSTYTGETWIQSGSGLALSGAGAIANSSRVIADGIFDVSAVTTAAEHPEPGGQRQRAARRPKPDHHQCQRHCSPASSPAPAD